MDIHVHNYHPIEPEQPKMQFSANDLRKIFKAKEGLFDFLIKCGFNEEEASKEVIIDFLRKK